MNIYQAGLRALRRAVEQLRPLVPGFVLVDGREIPDLGIPQSAYPKGDAFVTSIAAASIVAKCHRDALMRELDDALSGVRLRAPHGLRDARPSRGAARRTARRRSTGARSRRSRGDAREPRGSSASSTSPARRTR